ncbi:MAG: type II toxin-antitoxin system Phd/YefM family antitoxin [Rhodoferax sp.]|nr:type II toxin-antitoxin system Phd/YefM family antitoxin [Rhodoferax sp.]
MKYFTSTEAKTRFGEFIEAGMKGGVCLTRNGRPAGYLIPADDYEKGEAHSPGVAPGGGIAETLTLYSLGKIPRLCAMQRIGILDYGLLLRLLNAAGLPHPRPKEQDRRKLDKAFDAFMDQAQDG